MKEENINKVKDLNIFIYFNKQKEWMRVLWVIYKSFQILIFYFWSLFLSYSELSKYLKISESSYFKIF